MKPYSIGNLSYKESLFNFLTLFGSMSTLICCALPALLVSLGLGAVMAGLATNVPGLIWVSEHKVYFFIFAAVMLVLNGMLLWANRNTQCPVDKSLSNACRTGKKFSKVVYIGSLLAYSIGVYFAYIVPQV